MNHSLNRPKLGCPRRISLADGSLWARHRCMETKMTNYPLM